MGGCGKSQLALDFCERTRASGVFSAIFWIDGTSPTTVEQRYTFIAQNILKSRVDPLDPLANVRFVREFLDNLTAKWLLIFDNFDNPKAFSHQPVGNFVPQGRNGFVLFTTRDEGSHRLGDVIRVGDMTMNEAVSLLCLSSELGELVQDDSMAKKVCERLGCLALAIDQAGAYIHVRRISFSAFLDHFQSRKAIILNEVPQIWEYRRKKNDREAEQALCVATTWELSLDQISGDEHVREKKVHLLTLAAFLHGHNISDEFFQYNENPKWTTLFIHRGQWDSYAFADLIAELCRLSLVQGFRSHHAEASTLFSIHPLVQEWIKLRIGKIEYLHYAAEAIELLTSYIYKKDVKKMSLSERQATYSHLKCILGEVERHQIKSQSALVFSNFLSSDGKYVEAQDLAAHAVEIRKRALGDEHADTLTSMYYLAATYYHLCQWNRAVKLYIHIIKISKQVPGEDHPDTLTAMNGLIAVFWGLGLFIEAKELSTHVVETEKRVLGEEHPQTLSAMNNLAISYRQLGELNAAKELGMQVVETTKRLLGEEHPTTITSMSSLSIALLALGRLDEAEKLGNEVAEIQTPVLGKEHPNALYSMHNQALIYIQQGRLNEAEEVQLWVIKAGKRSLVEDHPLVLNTMHNLAATYQKQGRGKEAEELGRQVVEIMKRALGEDNPNTLFSMFTLALTISFRGRPAEAISLIADLMEKVRKHLPSHPAVESVAKILAQWKAAIGE
jgi:tetratricopeptide (TPR) repeat protein